MNEKFFELSEEKQLRIINAGLEVFGKHEYKHAITDDIASKAGISKGLLFHYFNNKKSYYLFLFNYCQKVILDGIINEEFEHITDFFELIRYGAKKKMEMVSKYPYMMEFVLHAFYSLNEKISKDINIKSHKVVTSAYDIYFKNIDITPFKEGVDPKKIYRMLLWMCDGYLHEKQKSNELMDFDAMMKEFSDWEESFKKMAYKEEYQ